MTNKSAFTPRHILLVEDNAINQTLVANLLRRNGHQVTVANDGLESVNLTATKAFDIILMDVQMPVMDGLQATRKIRERERKSGGHTPVVALTANLLGDDVEDCRQAGMDNHLGKPVDIEVLLEVIQRYTGG